MTARQFIYRTLTQDPNIVELIGGATDPRVWAKKSMTSSIEQHPYIVYKLGNESDRTFSEERNISDQFFQIYVQDYSDEHVSDYERIDTIVNAVKRAFFNAASPEDGVYGVRFLEVSQDLNDETLNTVFKYLRFVMIKEEA